MQHSLIGSVGNILDARGGVYRYLTQMARGLINNLFFLIRSFIEKFSDFSSELLMQV